MANQEVMQALEVKQLVVSSGGTLITSGVTKTRTLQVYRFPAKAGLTGGTATVGYVTANDTDLITLAQNATADTWVIPMNLKEGDIITSIGISGQIESGGNAVTVDYNIRATTAVATGCTDASIQAGTQIAKSADYLIADSTALAAAHTVASGESIYMLVTCTTAATTDIELQYVTATITEK